MHQAPSRRHLLTVIVARELRLAAQRRGVKLLFLASLAPIAIFAMILVFRVVGQQALGQDLGWDPVEEFIAAQVFPVMLLTLGLGTPIIANDRNEDVLFLYATRPVGPWDYVLGKALSVMLPSFLLLFLPALVMDLLRLGILPQVGLLDFAQTLAWALLFALLAAWSLSGVALIGSALTQRSRWALLLAIALLVVPEILNSALEIPLALGPSMGINTLLETLFGQAATARGIWAGAVLLVYGAMGLLLPLRQVREEMRP